MQEFKKNQRVVKLEPKPMKVEGKILDLKNKGVGFQTGKPRGFHSPKGTMEPTREQEKKREDKISLNSVSWQVEEGGNNEKMSLAAKLIIFILLLTAAAGFIMESPIMVLTFILFTIVFYLFLKKGKRSIVVEVDSRGIKVDGAIYLYENLKTFWVFYDPPYEKYLSIGTKSSFFPYVRIRLGAQNPVGLRNYLVSYLAEIEHPVPLMEVMMERLGL